MEQAPFPSPASDVGLAPTAALQHLVLYSLGRLKCGGGWQGQGKG